MSGYNLLGNLNYSLPEPVPNRRQKPTSLAKCSKFLSRLIHFNQMDFQFAAWQMIHLFLSPQRVYKKSLYRKQTKNQYSRDDPAFLVITMACIAMSAAAMSLMLHLTFWSFIKLTFCLVLVDCIAFGLVVATVIWFLAVRYMKGDDPSIDSVEWGYAFDVHLNAFFPALIILHLLRTFLYSYLISHQGFMSHLLGNTLWMVAAVYYCYITYLGYRALPYLKGTTYILYSLVPAFFIYLIATLSGLDIMQMVGGCMVDK